MYLNRDSILTAPCNTSSSDPCASRTRASYSPRSIPSFSIMDGNVILVSVTSLVYDTPGQTSLCRSNGKTEEDCAPLSDMWNTHCSPSCLPIRYLYAV